MENQLEVIAGCYEQILFGYRVDRAGEAWTPVADFTHHAHTASLSVVAVSDRYIATGSKDETIYIYDMKKKVEHGALLHHNGTVSCLEFYGNTHLISGAEDGLICIWSTKKWECLKSIRAHKGHVKSLSVHPSGKLALSVGRDKTLRTWNLIEGRSAFIKNIKQEAHIVKWSPKGEKYIVVIDNKVDIYQLETASLCGSITNEKRISSVIFVTESVLAVAGDEEYVRLYDIDLQQCLLEFKAHANRVKSVYSFEIENSSIIVTASNDGFIKLWKLNMENLSSPFLLGEVNTGARLTCLTIWLSSLNEMSVKSENVEQQSEEKNEAKPFFKKKKAKPAVAKALRELEDTESRSQRKRKKTDGQKSKKREKLS